METPQELAARLTAGLARLAEREKNPAATQLAKTTEQLSQQLSELPEDLRQLIHTAESGFPVSGGWVDDTIAKQDQQIEKLARAAGMVASWYGPDGLAIERTFILRGNIRGWAHRWRTAEKGTAKPDTDPAFVEFATECLCAAGIEGDATEHVRCAVHADWRTLPPV